MIFIEIPEQRILVCGISVGDSIGVFCFQSLRWGMHRLQVL